MASMPAYLLTIRGTRDGAAPERVAASLGPQLNRSPDDVLPALRLRKPIEVRISDVPLRVARAFKERADGSGADCFLDALDPLPEMVSAAPERFKGMKLRPFSSAWAGLLLNAPETWQDVSRDYFQVHHADTKTYITASRTPNPGFGLQVWVAVRCAAVKDAFPAFEPVGAPYRLDTAAGMAIAAEFRGPVPGETSDTHQLVVCLGTPESLVSLNVTGTPEEFAQHAALYHWLICTQLKPLTGAVTPELSGIASSHPQAHYDQGRQFAVAKRFKEAAEWFRKAADQGHAVAQFDLGNLYFEGLGLAQSDAQTLRWWRKAAELGHAGAQMNVASMLDSGRAVNPDPIEALRWKMKAAEGGHAGAQYLVAIHYLKGNGVEKDSARCAHWALRSAEQDHADAEYVLGLLYEVGEGVAMDVERAKAWFRRAAEHGKTDAQQKLLQLGA
jgi:hypothetical protein